jgi:hypothetical protein
MPSSTVSYSQLRGLGIPYSAAVLRQMWMFNGFPVPLDGRSKWDRAQVLAWVRQHITRTAAQSPLPGQADDSEHHFLAGRVWRTRR